MTVPATSRRREYQTNGVTRIFDGPMSYISSYVRAYLRDGSGAVTELAQSSYNVERLGRTNGVRVIFDAAPASGYTLILLRVMPYQQDVDITNQGAFLPETVEKGYDDLAMQIQQLNDLSFQQSLVGGFFSWDALGLRIRNVGSPVLSGDASNKGYTDARDLAEAVARALADDQLRAYIETLVAGLPSGLGYFTQGGVGSVPRTFQDVLRETDRPKDRGAVGDGVSNDTVPLQNSMRSSRDVYIAAGQTLYLPSGLAVSGLSDLNIYGGGRIKLGPGATLSFTDCPRLRFSVSVVGNNLPKAQIASFSTSGTTASIVLADIADPGVDYVADKSGFNVGDLVQAMRYNDGIANVAYRGVVTGRSGDTLSLNNDTTLGGSATLLANGQEMVVDSSTSRYTNLEFTRCNDMLLDGYFESGVSITNCTGATVGDVSMYKAGLALYYCASARVNSYESRLSNFYGFGAFKCRSLGLGNIRTDKAGVGGMVIKNCWAWSAGSVDVRRARCYGWQIRDDNGTLPSLVNPDLQNSLDASIIGGADRVEILDSYRGIWFDDTCKDLHFGMVSISGTIGGASIQYEGAHNISIDHLTVNDHFIHGPPTGYFNSNVPISIAGGYGFKIDKLVMRGCLHTGSLITTTGSQHFNFSVDDSDIRDCLGTINLGSSIGTHGVFKARNPRASIGAFILLSGCTDALIERCSFESDVGTSCTSMISVSGNTQRAIIKDNVSKSGVSLAGVYIDATGENVQVFNNNLYAASTYGVSVRGSTSALVVRDNPIRNATTPLHSTSLTSTDHVIRGAPIAARGAFAAASLAAGAQEFIDVPLTGVGPSNFYQVQVAGVGNSLGLQYFAMANSSNNVRIWRRNGSAATVSAPAETVIFNMSVML